VSRGQANFAFDAQTLLEHDQFIDPGLVKLGSFNTGAKDSFSRHPVRFD
jgi:hypothetical protein